MPSANIIEVNNLCYNANEKNGALLPLLNDISFKIKTKDSSKITAIMGPNGAGKSLLLRNLAGLLSPNSGTILWHDNNCISAKDLAIVFQKPVLLRRTVRANLEHTLLAFKTPKDQLQNRTNQLLKLGQLTSLANRPARILSGGEQQRVAMVRALAGNPKILLLDEATASLDPQTTLLIEALINKASKNNTKIIMVTHDLGQAQRMAHDVLFINNGTICEHTSKKQFLLKPKSQAAKNYISGKLTL